ncbi:MAG: hypothetical protein V4489_09455 [Chlamydiota bacterium]
MIPWFLPLIPFIVQAVAITADEFFFHIKRGLPLWERIGHPFDTLSVLACFIYILLVPFSPAAIWWFAAIALLSCLLITKDEFVHKHHCPAKEQWLHALLFVNHPIMLLAAALIWPTLGESPTAHPYLSALVSRAHNLETFLYLQTGFIFIFMIYQIIYWNFIWREKKIS